jgi:beta-galactosidase/beta-glucuronidase
LRDLADKLDGTSGHLVAPLPLDTSFSRDPFNEGVLAEWYAPDFDDSGWGTENTFYTWDQQDEPMDAAGHDYDGYGWYRAELHVDKRFAGRTVHLHCAGALNEAWVWVNGRYAGHRPHRLWWHGDREIELDVTDLIHPGRANTLAIRVWNDAEIGGLYGRGFLYSPSGGKP